MNEEEKANYEKLLNDLSSEKLSDQEIVEMWQAPALQQVEAGLSKFKLEQFLITKGVSKEYAPKGAKWILSKAGVDNITMAKKVTLGSIFTDMGQSILKKFKFKD